MKLRLILSAALLMALLSITMIGLAQDAKAGILADFEVAELFEGRDPYNNAIGHAPWGDITGNVALALAQQERDGAESTVLEINYDIGAWGGFTHALTDGESWLSQDWTAYNAVRFWLYGNNTGGKVQVEIFDNRNPNITGDSAERWYHRIADDYDGWMEFTIEFRSFQRRTDWQPGGAPDDGLGLDKVSGLAFGFPAGTGAQTAYLDDVHLVRLDVQPLMLDDFEMDELFIGVDPHKNDIGYITWGDTPGNVELSLFQAKRGGLESTALNMSFDIAAWGGFSHVFNDGENWVTQDWRDYNAISFAFLGNNSGGVMQFELFDNRNPDFAGDSAERWFYRFEDDAYGWRLVEIPFVEFQRRSDWQPEGAPDDGLGLDAVSAYAFGLLGGISGAFAIIDDVQLVSMSGVAMPASAVRAEAAADTQEWEPAALPEVMLNEALLGPIPFAEPAMVADYENGLHYVSQVDGAAIGFVPWGDSTANAIIGVSQILPFTTLALPEADAPNQILRIDYNVGAWGGFTHAFNDGVNWLSMDWSGHNALQFWLYGNETGRVVQIEIFDNRQMDSAADSAERFFYHLLDDYEGWQHFTIPFAFFQRRADWQPAGAPDDGFNLDAVWGYAVGFPAGVGARTAYLDQVMITVVEDPSQVQIAASDKMTKVEIDQSVGWDTREWQLLWSDEFDAEAGAPINGNSWTCEIGGHGWGNNEMEYYTDRTENVSHDGMGNLVITAREETLEGSTCHYGECLYTSARCITQDKVEFTYGRVEARIDIPNGQGIWPAFWMLGANFPEMGWPLSGEIDILENIGEKNVVYGTLHGPGYSGGSGIGGAYRADANLDEGYHIYAIDWDEHVIRWYVDGELANMVSVNALDGKQWVYDHDFFLLLNLAVGGYWPGYPDETTEFPQEMIVDYVRVYQLAK